MTVYKHYSGYSEAKKTVMNQSLEDDLRMIDGLQGRDNLAYSATPEDVKQEALRQLEIEWRECIDEESSFWINVVNEQRKQHK